LAKPKLIFYIILSVILCALCVSVVKKERLFMILEFSEKGIVFFPDPTLIGTPTDYGM
jgi:hypothetical protein